MKTFVINSGRHRAKVLGDHIELTSAQYAAAKVVSGIHLSAEELIDLMSHIGDEGQRRAGRSHNQPKVKKAPPVVSAAAAPLPSWAAPVLANEPRLNLDGLTWQQMADLGPAYKIRAIKVLWAAEPAYHNLKLAKERVEEYLACYKKD